VRQAQRRLEQGDRVRLLALQGPTNSAKPWARQIGIRIWCTSYTFQRKLHQRLTFKKPRARHHSRVTLRVCPKGAASIRSRGRCRSAACASSGSARHTCRGRPHIRRLRDSRLDARQTRRLDAAGARSHRPWLECGEGFLHTSFTVFLSTPTKLEGAALVAGAPQSVQRWQAPTETFHPTKNFLILTCVML
jgi:hypothetical protein